MPLRKHFSSFLHFARAEPLALAALCVVSGGVLAFIDIADDSAEAKGQAFDQRVLDMMRPLAPNDPIGPPWLEHAAADLTSLGALSVLGLMALIAVGYLLMRKSWGDALMMCAALLGGLALSETLKGVFERSRPPAIYHGVESLNPSFPSGHALLSTVFYLTLGAMLTRAMKHRREKAYVLCVALLLALIVGVTRVYLGVHWASDVLGGWCLGAAWAMVCWLVAYALRRRLTPSPTSTIQSG